MSIKWFILHVDETKSSTRAMSWALNWLAKTRHGLVLDEKDNTDLSGIFTNLYAVVPIMILHNIETGTAFHCFNLQMVVVYICIKTNAKC